ncbi:MAG: tetratricopeptide repeat protein [candidate division WOR-3 bacterium]
MKLSFPRWLAPVSAIVLNVALRLWFVFEMRGQPFSTISRYFVDSCYYHQQALDILSNNLWGKEVFFLRPLYPYLLATVYRVFGVRILAVQLVQTGMAGVSCLLLYSLCRRIFGTRAAILASFGLALTGILVFYSGTLLYVEVTILLSLVALWLTLTANQFWWRYLLAGIAWGLVAICRPELLLAFLVIAVWQRQSSRARDLAVMIGTAILVVASVPVRNFIVAREPVIFTAHSGLNFYYGNNPSADGTWQPTAELEGSGPFSHDRLKRVSRTIHGQQLSWSEASAFWFRQGLSFIISHPGSWLRLLGRKLMLFVADYEVPNTYYPETARVASTVLKLTFVSFGAVLALGVIGMYRTVLQRRQALPAFAFLAAYFASALVFYVLSRLRAPMIPFLLAFAGFGLSELVELARNRRYRALGIHSAVALFVYVVSLLVPVDKTAYSAQAWVQLGNILLEQRQTAKALAAFDRALGYQPANPWTRYSMVMTLAATSRVAEAESALAPLARLAAGNTRARLPATLAGARLAIARRDFARAARLYRLAISLDSTDAEASYLLGLVYISLDSLASADYWLARALALDSNHEPARAALSAVRSRRGSLNTDLLDSGPGPAKP